MFNDLKKISPLVKAQFPDFYLEEGDNFLQFVKAYYEWMDSTNNTIYKSRRLGEFTDIDQTLDDYVKYFLSKYMHGIPRSVLADKRLLVKHIKDFYRSKGSIENLNLLFRIMYNTDINVYLPQVDMLRPSDGKWTRRQYIEVVPSINHFNYIGKIITGATSGATAYVENSIRLNINRQPVYILYISDITLNIVGQSFIIGEFLLYDGLTINDSDRVIGSPVGADVISSSENFTIGDVLITNSTTGRNLKYNVNKLYDSNLSKGYITFKIVDGGEGYTTSSIVTLSYDTATSGVGANFKVGSISNPVTFLHNTTLILPYVGTAINSADYGPGLNNATENTIIADALDFESVTVGTIASLTAVTSGNKQYNGTLNVNVYEPISYGYGWIGNNGGIWGNNALISATPSTGNGVIESVSILSSGYGYNKQGELLDFINQSNTNLEANLSINIDGVGTEEGYWKDESSFLNDNKFIQDSYYYQEYSYEIQTNKSLDKYIDVVKKLSHPVGNKIFGKPLIIDNVESFVEIVYERVKPTPEPPCDQFENGDLENGLVNWNFYNQQISPGGVLTDPTILSSLVGYPVPADPTPKPAGLHQILSTGQGLIISNPLFNTELNTTDSPTGTCVELSVSGNIFDGGGTVYGPAFVSQKSICADVGDRVKISWKAAGGGDAYNVLAYIIDTNRSGRSFIVLDETGDSQTGQTDWAYAYKVINPGEAGEYYFVFLCGSFDYTFGKVLGAKLLVDNIQIEKAGTWTP
jgi:hypothetical protein